MKTSLSPLGSALEEKFGRNVAARLTAGNAELDHDIGERLRVARAQAVARRKTALQMRPAAVAHASGGALSLGGGWWPRLGAIVPLVALVVGLFAISAVQDDNKASELADVDTALLTDDLPPAAYTDSGFAQFLRSEADKKP